MIQLTRPLVVLDLETTGISVATDRIVEIAMIKMQTDGSVERVRHLINPEMAIPKQSSDVHGILDADVADKPTFKQLAEEIKAFLHQCDLAGYNSNKFDIPLLSEEFKRVGVEIDFRDRFLVDAHQIFLKMERRNLEAAYQFYCNKKLENSHSALADAEATMEVLLGQLEKYPELNVDVKYLNDFSKGEEFMDYGRRIKEVEGIAIFNFGKHKGISVEEIFKKEANYYHWMMKGDFAQDTKEVITKIYLKMKNNK